MSSTATFPVRLAQTVNRFGSSRRERLTRGAAAPTALVTVGQRTFTAPVYAERVTRRGHQTLVALHGHLTWVASRHVQLLPPDDAA